MKKLLKSFKEHRIRYLTAEILFAIVVILSELVTQHRYTFVAFGFTILILLCIVDMILTKYIFKEKKRNPTI